MLSLRSSDADRSSFAWIRAFTRIASVAPLLLAAMAPSCGAQGVPVSTETLTVAQQREVLKRIDAVGRRGFLYEVSGAPVAGTTPGRKLYLYGTIHVGRVGSEPFNGPVMKALRLSRRLALEADTTDSASTQALAMRLGQYGEGDELRRHVSPALMARVLAFGEKNGLPVDRVGRFKPWLLANMVALKAVSGIGLDSTMGSELYLSGYARTARMPIVEIEGVEAQLQMLASLPDAMQTAQLDEALDEVDSSESRSETRTLFELWLSGDAKAGDALVEEMHRDAEGKVFEHYFIEALIDRRNRTMADQAESYLTQPGNTFFAVGALHLFGDAGLIREFERRGYRVMDLQPPLDGGR
jgi:uncharacterized protein YbaP (TraB family)